jgi:hypothetical protein
LAHPSVFPGEITPASVIAIGQQLLINLGWFRQGSFRGQFFGASLLGWQIGNGPEGTVKTSRVSVRNDNYNSFSGDSYFSRLFFGRDRFVFFWRILGLVFCFRWRQHSRSRRRAG